MVLKILTCIRTCEHMILGQLRMGARQAKNAPLVPIGVRENNPEMLRQFQTFQNSQSSSHQDY